MNCEKQPQSLHKRDKKIMMKKVEIVFNRKPHNDVSF